jgi:hypothetical protein
MIQSLEGMAVAEPVPAESKAVLREVAKEKGNLVEKEKVSLLKSSGKL